LLVDLVERHRKELEKDLASSGSSEMIAAIDDCKDGWLIAMAERWSLNAGVQIVYSPEFADCLSRLVNCDAVVVDMPIGLPSGSESRKCDDEARQKFPALASSIFCTPPRSTLKAESAEEFQSLHRPNILELGYFSE